MKTLFVKTSLVAAFAALFLTLAVPQQSRAQAQIEIGPRVGYEIEDLNALSLGADVRASTFALPLQLNGSFDYYFADSDFDVADEDFPENDFVGAENAFRVAASAIYEAGLGNQQYFTPYFGPGVSVTRISYAGDTDLDDRTNLGVNVVGGLEFGVGALRPFVQAETSVLGDAQPVQLTGGLLFSIGRN